ncbi:alpha amylase C-terminal domain-containing protein [Salipiger bermudensis]
MYGGSNRGNYGSVEASDGEYHGQPAHADVTIPPLSAIYLVRDT